MTTPAALVTGGGTRLGAAFALYLAEKGFDVALHYNSSREQAQQVQADIVARGRRCDLLQWDFLASDDPAALLDATLQAFPNLQLLLNSASVYDAAPTGQTTLELLQQQFKVNCFTPFLLTARFAEKVGKGQVINILDNKIAYQQYHYSAYLLSKKSLADFTTMAAMEFAPRIRVNGIAPGVVMPGVVRTSDYIDWRIDGIPLKHQGKTDNLCQALGYLIDNDFVTGQCLFVDGGEGINHIGRNAETYAAQQGGDER
ncbi:SDR family NAD(P)-dependent oxidoreductase [Pseudomaricurvus sp. HS19]|uniref:SDR family NAD(P)-dependent oxidoreductase n=1 Tax=Pseudomaricurvus sp. HS19 TaxID=2692626 RepID=UPI00136BAFA7|nr:SDR family NAD(P)-dependent oxidoreductase [Pseudomaricurvus sp. HS19]MYM62959.1 SDR family NAD(P)-dependent oxidoreductase [Pseudomaricurvus sp. HS19]